MSGSDDDSMVDEPTSHAAHSAHRLRKWIMILVLVLVVLPTVVVVSWAAVSLNYSYSAGDRAGYVQKFSQKGWLCKTWEGELSMVNLPGAVQEKWEFSVRDDSVAAAIVHAMGARVTLQYEQHRGVPTSCFGETQYFVVAVHPVAGP